jgi:hypothetical protein
MKNIVILAFLGIMVIMPELSQASDNKSFSQSEIQRTNGGGRKNKSGTYRRKKGFMWGLFRGKKQCDCPKH